AFVTLAHRFFRPRERPLGGVESTGSQLVLSPGPGTDSISSGRRISAPFGTNAAITGRLSDLRRVMRGGFSLRYLSPHWRSPASVAPRSLPFVVSRYS